MKEAVEGVIKFTLDHEVGEAPPADLTTPLRAWFRVLRRLELLGRDPHRYQGYAYGNLSRRHGETFVITCSQTGGREDLHSGDFSRVLNWSLDANRLVSSGPCPPSSEALTHAALYEQVPACHFVFHVHSSAIWQNMESLGIPATDPEAEYGTPEMAEATTRLLEEMGHPGSGILGMGGHQDGILAWGETAETAGATLVALLARAYAVE